MLFVGNRKICRSVTGGRALIHPFDGVVHVLERAVHAVERAIYIPFVRCGRLVNKPRLHGDDGSQDENGERDRVHGFAVYHGRAEFVTGIAPALIAAYRFGNWGNYVL